MSPSSLSDADRDQILARYQGRFAAHGASVAALASGSEAKQALRHRVLREIGMDSGHSVLDIGCGLGNFLAHAQEAGFDVAYTGLDLVPEFIAACHARFGEIEGRRRFEVAELFADGCAPIRRQVSHDWVIASQVFNNRYSDHENWNRLCEALPAMYDRCRLGSRLIA